MTIGGIFHESMTRRRVSFRRYGRNNEFSRPIIHRFDIKGGATLLDVMADGIVNSNSLYRRLVARGP